MSGRSLARLAMWNPATTTCPPRVLAALAYPASNWESLSCTVRRYGFADGQTASGSFVVMAIPKTPNEIAN